ncbi:YetF domain-containing protein [Alkaliphilus peptidifermentans]|uniref:Uncharacterized membrane protein YcaP, DUF421 family n=1 Tax=Alkaliphilus peptidifermentans DSM 18978 TaxID=1120976 RepID=A0A1G5G1A0_9FIRM|nr:DUF421 domain-containing protein [Alkaliphilus peptidifermentans]SCY45365.1 Uncharacterized membrane protein YcaP, DUF421 family [Alkaliphilus peptidifermentans DSM 18978]
MEYVNITLRIITIMGLLLFLILMTGRRKIGELPVFDFLTIIILGNVVGADIADPKVPHIPTAYAITLLIGIQYLISSFTIKNRWFGGKVTFEPIVIIQKGQFIKSNMGKVKYSIENILMFLREKGIFDINEVEYAIVEDSGNVSVMKKSQLQPVTPSDMKIGVINKGLTLPLVVDGMAYEENLQKLNQNKEWLLNQLKMNNINSFDEVFYAEINTEGKLSISKATESNNFMKDFRIL